MRFVRCLAALALIGCNGGGGAADNDTPQVAANGTGLAEVSVPLQISEITSVVVTITAPDIVVPIVANLAVLDEMATGLIAGIPAGPERKFSVFAYVQNVLVCTAVKTVPIVPDTRVTVDMLLDCSVPAPSTGEAEVVAGFNFPPTIASVSAAPSAVPVDGIVALNVVASDPNGDVLTYAWTATGGTFTDAAAATTVWTAPSAAGEYEITIAVSDGTTSVAMTIKISVTPA